MNTQRPAAVLNGRFIDADDLTIPVSDAGFVLGVTVAEQIRTFGGRLFRLEQHLERLFNSLQIVGVEIEFSAADLQQQATELAARNWPLIDPADDIGLSIFVTPGGYSTLEPEPAGPRVAMHTYPLPFQLWADKFTSGQRLSIVDVRQVPTVCWPAELKCRSRMHYFLADREAQQIDAASRALLLDTEGFVCEASTANVVLYLEGEGFICPRPEKILPGISVAVLQELAAAEGIAWTHRDIVTCELHAADEILLSSTSVCTLPVSAINCRDSQGATVSFDLPCPGPLYQRMLARWNELTGIDVATQATAGALRRRLS